MAALAGLATSAALTHAANVLSNTGFETGNISSWTGVGGGANPPGAFVESTNLYVYNSGNTIHVTVHSGVYAGKIFGQFVGYNNFCHLYQDKGTGAGSVWSANGWAATESPDNIAGLNSFYFEVTFRDGTDNVLAMYRSSPITTNTPVSTWANYPVTNIIDLLDLTTVTGHATTFTAPAGTAKIRFDVVYSQNVYDGGSVYFDDLVLNQIAASDPEISSPPASQTRVVGQNVVFDTTAAGGSTLNFSWYKNMVLLSDVGNISGSSTHVLTVSSATLADAGPYSVVVSDLAGSQQANAQLKMVPVAEVNTNSLSNSSFEDGVFSLPWEDAWHGFNGVALANTNDYYYLSATHVSTVEGTNCVQLYSQGPGSYNGIYQNVPVAPGEIYTASAMLLTPTDDPLTGADTGWLEIKITGPGGLVAYYKSAVISSNSPTATWILVAPTNQFQTDYTTYIGSPDSIVIPPGANSATVQVNHLGADGGGSVYVDVVDFRLRAPVFTAARNGSNIDISFATRYGASYNVLYKNNLSDANWQTLTTVMGTGNPMTVSDPTTTHRFYVVNTQ